MKSRQLFQSFSSGTRPFCGGRSHHHHHHSHHRGVVPKLLHRYHSALSSSSHTRPSSSSISPSSSSSFLSSSCRQINSIKMGIRLDTHLSTQISTLHSSAVSRSHNDYGDNNNTNTTTTTTTTHNNNNNDDNNNNNNDNNDNKNNNECSASFHPKCGRFDPDIFWNEDETHQNLTKKEIKKSKQMADQRERDVRSFCKEKGFVFPGSEIYNGFQSSYDYGPLGTQLKRNIMDRWWLDNVTRRADVVGLDSSIITHPSIWEAAGHVDNFSDPLVECKQCNARQRADNFIEDFCKKENVSFDEFDQNNNNNDNNNNNNDDNNNNNINNIKNNNNNNNSCDTLEAATKSETGLKKMSAFIFQHQKLKCPNCGAHEWAPVSAFNLLFNTTHGSTHKAYLRPETAQGIFVNFPQIVRSMRISLPFGVAQVGKSFRNEISPGQFLFRTREFEQMEMEYFCFPEASQDVYQDMVTSTYSWLVETIGLKKENLRVKEHFGNDLAHYAKGCADIEYKYPWGFSELWGIANRGDYDLKCHQEASGKSMIYLDSASNRAVLPHVVEPSVGLDRLVLAVLCDAYIEETVIIGDDKNDEKEKETIKEEEEEGVENDNNNNNTTTNNNTNTNTNNNNNNDDSLHNSDHNNKNQTKKKKTKTKTKQVQTRWIFKVHPALAPVKLALMPMRIKSEKQMKMAKELQLNIMSEHNWECDLDSKGSIGRRYRRQDQIGTPFCVTIDTDSEEDGMVTIRDRDSMEQVRLHSQDLMTAIALNRTKPEALWQHIKQSVVHLLVDRN